MTTYTSRAAVGAPLLLAAILSVASEHSARAATQTVLVPVGFSLAISADQGVLSDPNSPMVNLLAAWTLSSDLAAARSNPYFDLTNDSPTAEVTQFCLTIGDTANRWDAFELISDGAGVNVLSSIIDGGDKLLLELSNFTAGDTIRFRGQIRPDDPNVYQYPDYRTVLFDANGPDPSGNAIATAKFDDPDLVMPVEISQQLENYAVDEPFFVAPEIRYHTEMDHVSRFELQVGQVVPEPSGIVLAVLAALSGAAMLRRGRQKKAGAA